MQAYAPAPRSSQTGSLLETLRKYEHIVSQLNLFERNRVEYLGAAQSINLYVYLVGQIKDLRDRVYTASVEFSGNFSVSEKTNIFTALQNGMKNNGITLRLLDAPSNTVFKFVITGDVEKNSYDIVRWTRPGLSMQFVQEKSIGPSALIDTSPELYRNDLMSRTVREIVQRNSFFHQIKELLARG